MPRAAKSSAAARRAPSVSLSMSLCPELNVLGGTDALDWASGCGYIRGDTHTFAELRSPPGLPRLMGCYFLGGGSSAAAHRRSSV